jgi:hypothetical protein
MAKRSSGGWLDYWFSSDRPARPGTRSRGGSRSGSRSGSGAGSLSWWLAPVGSSGRPTRGGTGTRGRKPRVEEGRHCPICGKGVRCRCRAADGQPIPRRRAPRGRPYTTPPDFRAYGAVWCGSCRSRINTYTGKCMNTRCRRP